ncbi:MAG: Uma2 family endonuclease [Gloeomargarita sp. SKYG116]|nr:Uma2 family endonuclease [Gloeomargarita sp. SKYG116]MCS7293543.1 Uma2 family endonuclease [Gloeomargarita sp. SKYB120]MDW8179109.1 Uma2 family endonuclease [Gloeomargarita sp. SKYBB_i_bin120]MDW8401207.1 Uma2 family endonuclease [Gloeomargarita sp. SKYGB_i_bin116]
MVAVAGAREWTDAEWLALPQDGHRYELVNGELVDMGSAGMAHGEIGAYLGGCLAIYVRRHKLGIVCDGSTAFTLKSGNRRSPDIAFVRRERLQGFTQPFHGFFAGSPDLVVEILSPGNTVAEMHEKIEEYFQNQTRLVWVIHPAERFVLVYHQPEPDSFLRINDILDGEDVVPGFTLPVAELFPSWEF